MMNVDEVVLLSQCVVKAHKRVESLKQELQHIVEFTGVGYCSISLSSKQRTTHIDFGQLMEVYEDSLLPTLEYIAEQRIKQAEKELVDATTKLQEACNTTKPTTEGMMQQYHTNWDGELLVDVESGKLIPSYICICFAHESSDCVCGGWDVDIQEWEDLFGKIEQ